MIGRSSSATPKTSSRTASDQACPTSATWSEEHYDFAGYVTGFAPPDEAHRLELRERLGHTGDAPLVIVTVGGTTAGEALLRKVIAAYPRARDALGELRMVVVCGPRIDPGSMPAVPGVELHGYVPDLHLHLAACDAAIVQGGLTTTMELVAARRPFLYFPLANHFEQQRHVRHRLDRHRAGRCMDFAETGPDDIAKALVDVLSTPVDYAPVATDGAARAARLIAELL